MERRVAVNAACRGKPRQAAALSDPILPGSERASGGVQRGWSVATRHNASTALHGALSDPGIVGLERAPIAATSRLVAAIGALSDPSVVGFERAPELGTNSPQLGTNSKLVPSSGALSDPGMVGVEPGPGPTQTPVGRRANPPFLARAARSPPAY